jgi:hypothetical protein
MALAQSRRTHCRAGHPFDAANTCRSNGRRHCLTCQRDRRRLKRPPRTLTEELWARIERQADGCWTWTGSIGSQGYGVFGRHGLAHRIVYELVVEPIPDALVLDHLCRVRHCVNPCHLEPCTLAENVRRGAESRRAGR